MNRVFGTEMVLVTFGFTIVEIIVWIFLALLFASRPSDLTLRRALLLVSFFIVYNLCSGLFPDDNLPINMLLQHILAYGSGIALGVYYFYFQTEELGLKLGRFLNWKSLLAGLSASFLLGYVLVYLLVRDFTFSKKLFIGIPLVITLYFCVMTIRALIRLEGNFKSKALYYSGYAGVVFMTTMPLVVAFGDYQALNTGLVNMSFVLTATAVLIRFIIMSRKEAQLLQELNASDHEIVPESMDLLTKREKALLNYLLNGEITYKQIADNTHIAPKTVSKHASNIFKKLEVSHRSELIEKYSNYLINNKLEDEIDPSKQDKN